VGINYTSNKKIWYRQEWLWFWAIFN